MAAFNKDVKLAKLVYNGTITVYVKLHIRNGTALILRGLCMLVTDQPVGETLLGRPLLQALGLNTRDNLASAEESNSGVVDVYTLLKYKIHFDENGRVSHVLEDVYHDEGGSDDNYLDDNYG